MSQAIPHDPSEYQPAREVAARCSLSRDYVTRLAREHKIKAVRVKNGWHVSESSLRAFCEAQDAAREERRTVLSNVRRDEYRHGEIRRSAVSSMRQAVKELTDKRAMQHIRATPLYAIHPMLDLVHRATALAGAIALVVGLYALLYPPSLQLAADIVRATAAAAASFISW